MTKFLATSVIGLAVLASGCSQTQSRQESSTIISERVPISVAARMRDNQPLTPKMIAEAKERRIPLNRPALRSSMPMEMKPVVKTVKAPELRPAPKPKVEFVAENYEVELFEDAKNPIDTSLEVELFAEAPVPAPVQMGPADPRDTAFLKLNGQSKASDWTSCETSRGYILAVDEKLYLDPGFEVCMRNKGYVMAHEISDAEGTILTAEIVGQTSRIQSVSAPAAIDSLP